MVRLLKIKLSLFLIAILLGVWNFFLRESLNIPFLSNLSDMVVWFIVGVLILVTAIINWTFKEKKYVVVSS